MHISRVLKEKRDKENRLVLSDPGKGIVFSAGSETEDPSFVEPARQRFTQLTDTPSGYADQAGKQLVVNEAETGVEFVEDTPATWYRVYEPLTNANPFSPAILFCSLGDIIMVEVI